jgi:mRNA-degrading endonuclease RelE of RelBE toxin-antitoxin system
MNTKLVDSIVQLIESLSPAERTLLEEKLNARERKPDPQEEYRLLVALREKISARRGGSTV